MSSRVGSVWCFTEYLTTWSSSRRWVKHLTHTLTNLSLMDAFLRRCLLSCCCCSVTKSYPTLWDPMDYSTPGFPVLTLKIVMIMLTPRSGSWCKFHHIFLPPRVCSNSCPLSQWCYLTISSFATFFSFAFSLFQHQGLFQSVLRWIP